MHGRSRRALLVVSLLIASACGGTTTADSASAPTITPATTRATTTTVVAPATTAVATTAVATTAPTTSTTAPPVTTTIATTTQPTDPPDAHPSLGGPGWASLWPPDGATAVYRVTSFGGDQADLETRIEYGVEFDGRALDRIVFGSDAPGADGLVVYFDRTEPWVFKILSSQVFRADVATGPVITEFFDVPLPFDASQPLGEPSEMEATVRLDFGGSTDAIGAIYRTTVTSIDETLTVPFGTIENVVHVEAAVGGEFMGGGEFVAEIWLHPEHVLLRMTGSPAWDDIELVSPFA